MFYDRYELERKNEEEMQVESLKDDMLVSPTKANFIKEKFGDLITKEKPVEDMGTTPLKQIVSNPAENIVKQPNAVIGNNDVYKVAERELLKMRSSGTVDFRKLDTILKELL